MTFVLRIDPVQVDRDFKTMERSVPSEPFNPMVTKLEDLGIDEKQNMVEPDTSIPEHGIYYYKPLLKEYGTNASFPATTPIPCYYCTEPFHNTPVGIPLLYVPSYVERVHISERDGSKMFYQQDIRTKREQVELEKKGVSIVHRDYYHVEGNFCSFYCMKSFIGLRKSEYQTKNVEPLIKELYFKMYGSHLESVSAPDIRLLKKFGGHLSISEFRSKEGRLYSRQLQHHYVEKKHSEPTSVRVVPCFTTFRYMGNKLN